jgi:hypothetical protein
MLAGPSQAERSGYTALVHTEDVEQQQQVLIISKQLTIHSSEDSEIRTALICLWSWTLALSNSPMQCEVRGVIVIIYRGRAYLHCMSYKLYCGSPSCLVNKAIVLSACDTLLHMTAAASATRRDEHEQWSVYCKYSTRYKHC